MLILPFGSSALLALLTLVVPPAHADKLVAGDNLRIYFDSTGTWNDQGVAAGFQARHDGAWLDWTFAGYPWQATGFEYRSGGEDRVAYANSNTAYATCSVSGEADLSTADWAISQYSYDDGSVELVQTEAWERSGRAVRVSYRVIAGAAAVQRFRLFFAVDPDPDGAVGDYTTENDVLDADGDGLEDLVVSTASSTGYTLAFGACNAEFSELGHYGNWSLSSEIDSDVALTDDGGVVADSAMAIRVTPPTSLEAGAEGEVTFVVLEGDSVEEVEAAWLATDLCGACDGDGDGHDTPWCGGDDCDDASAAAFPGAPEVWYDGVDEDCDGASDFDQDADGFDDASGGGDDCDDTDGSVHPGATDVLYDGVDSDCDGASDFDADHDGYDNDDYGGVDCNDADALINPLADEIYYDDIDQNCDGNDDDADGDGYDSPLDCDDTSADIYPGAGGQPGDGVDSDCDGSDADVSADTGAVKVDGGCGCTSAPDASGAWMLGLFAAGMLRRARQNSAIG
jgi:MYXO-CTERM domain-containing protein